MPPFLTRQAENHSQVKATTSALDVPYDPPVAAAWARTVLYPEVQRGDFLPCSLPWTFVSSHHVQKHWWRASPCGFFTWTAWTWSLQNKLLQELEAWHMVCAGSLPDRKPVWVHHDGNGSSPGPPGWIWWTIQMLFYISKLCTLLPPAEVSQTACCVNREGFFQCSHVEMTELSHSPGTTVILLTKNSSKLNIIKRVDILLY